MTESNGARVTAKSLVQGACAQLEELIGRPVESASALERDGDGWRVLLEVEELARVPASTSLMASYEGVLDAEGSLLEYSRCRRYYRNQTDELD